ncbi:hypothetical protein HPB49_016222 [Dermacentor silvarum]|uniref:Uncharacterized protein n=1 Tax=Dermacentor silvarum TaxID=543639 RepID=A0ACB8E1Q5_DERSI|nr:hypothetical protein HPB49_016222 [Dermacentor silvarum]
MSQGPFREHHKYLQQAVLQLHRAEKLRPDKLNVLKTYVGGPNDASVWLLLSKLSLYCDLGQGDFAYSYWKQQWDDQPEGSNNPRASNETVNHVLIVLKRVSRHLPSNALREMIADLEQRLSQLRLPVEVIAHMVDCLHILKRNVHRDQPKIGERAIKVWCRQMLDKCETFLYQAVMGVKDEDSKLVEEQLVRHLVLLGEASQPAPHAVSSQLHYLVQACMTSSGSPEPTSEPDAKRGDIKKKRTRRSRAQRSGGGLRTTRCVRAHAVIVMGMFCIQNEMLAKTVVPTMGNSLSCSQDPMMRANLIVVLTDICKRYAVLVDPYLPIVTRCIKDSVPAIRSLVLTCLLQLLQQNFVKLHGWLFYRLLSALTDDEREIRELAEFGLVDCVLKRNTHVFYDRFVNCLFYFNAYRSSSGEASQESVVEVTERDRRLFSLEGHGRRDQRMALYRFMLLHMPDEDRFKLTLALTQSVLVPCADTTNTGLGMEEEYPELLHDALSVMGSEEIQLKTIVAAAEDAATEENPERALLHTTRKTILSFVVRSNLVDNVFPVVIALANKLEAARSPLLRSLLMYSRELMRDYKAQVDDMLSADKKLASEIPFDERRLEREEEEKAAANGRAVAAPKTPARAVNSELRELLETARKLKEEALKRRYNVALPQVASEEETTQQQNGNGKPTLQVHAASTRAAEKGVKKISEEPAADQSTSKHTPSNAWLINQASSSASLESASSKGGSRASPSGRPMDSSRNPAAPAASKSASEVMPRSRSNSCTNSTARKELVMDVTDSQVQEQANDVSMEEAAPDSPQTWCFSLSDLSDDISALSIEDTTDEAKKITKRKSRIRMPPLGVPIPGRPQSQKLPIKLGETDLVQSSPLQNLATSLANTPAHSETDAGHNGVRQPAVHARHAAAAPSEHRCGQCESEPYYRRRCMWVVIDCADSVLWGLANATVLPNPRTGRRLPLLLDEETLCTDTVRRRAGAAYTGATASDGATETRDGIA